MRQQETVNSNAENSVDDGPIDDGPIDEATVVEGASANGVAKQNFMTKRSALVDLAILAVVFWGVWSLRFFGVANIGLWTMLAGVGVGLMLLKLRGQSFASIGLVPWSQGRDKLWPKTLGTLAVVGLATIGGAIVFISLLGPLQASPAMTEQPDTIGLFLLDILLGVWVGAALGEEIFFRGLLLGKFRVLFSGAKSATVYAIVAQAVWFGAGHAGQGLTGIVLAGFIGLCLGFYYIHRTPGNLWPMIIAHGLANTFTLTLSFVQSAAAG